MKNFNTKYNTQKTFSINNISFKFAQLKYKSMKQLKLLILSLLIFSTFNTIHAQDDEKGTRLNSIESVIPFITIAPDSRSGAMGDVGAATSPDIFSQHWNPAKYAFMEGQYGIATSFTPWLRNLVNDINLAYLSGYYRIDDKQTISGALMYFSLGNVRFTSGRDDDGWDVNPNEFSIDLGYSRMLSPNLSGALSLGFILSNIAPGGGVGLEEFKPGYSFKAGLSVYQQKEIQLSGLPGEFAWGVNISNLGTPISYTDNEEKNFIPTNLRVGTRMSIDMDDYNSFNLAFDINKLMVPTPPVYYQDSLDASGKKVIKDGREKPNSAIQSWIQSFYDAPDGFIEEWHEFMFSVGGEYWYRKQFAIRGGYFYEHETKGNRKYFATGVGLKLNVLTIDFSYLIPTAGRNNPLANTMRFSLSFDFDKFSNYR